MRVVHFLLLTVLFLFDDANAQESDIIGAPMVGHVAPTSANVLVLTQKSTTIWLQYAPVVTPSAPDNSPSISKSYNATHTDTLSRNEKDETTLHYFHIQLQDLTPNTKYEVHIYFQNPENGNIPNEKLSYNQTITFNTPPLAGTPADISFLIGSCAAPFQGWFFWLKGKNKIFDAMTAMPTDFMIWMGDNIYYLGGEWDDYEDMIEKNISYRQQPSISQFLNSRPQWATWDDHDFGPNNAHGDFQNKHLTLQVFQYFWANEKWGATDSLDGIYSKFSYADADFFLMDGRYFRTKWTKMFGDEQMQWLKSELKQSKATFKFIISGTQMLPTSKAEDWGDYPDEKNDFLQFIENENIEGIVFLSGDTHYAELSQLQREGKYPLTELTSSALTSPYFPGSARDQSLRLPKMVYTKRNFGRVRLYNQGSERVCSLELYNNKGKMIWQYILKASELK